MAEKKSASTNLQSTEELRATLVSRAEIYEMLASLYFKPLKQEQIDALAETDLSAFAEANEDCERGVQEIHRALRRRNSGTRQNLAIDFTAAFAGTSTYQGYSAVPYKSVFTSDSGLMMQEGYQEVFAAMKAESVRLRDGLDWPADHLSFLLQFIAFLSRRAEHALEDGRIADAQHDLKTSLEFMNEHILTWYDDFAAVANKIVKTRFYRGVLLITKGYMLFDKEVMADLQGALDELE